MRYFAGIDVGSLTAKSVVIDEDNRILGSHILGIGQDSLKAGMDAYREALNRAGLKKEAVSSIVSTGYSRKRFTEAAVQKTEISCHARGVSAVFPNVRTLIDVGGQDSKAMKISREGRVLEFAMNDKCAAGTGRFVDVMANALNLTLDGLSDEALSFKEELTLSSTCTVFGESEVVSLLSQGQSVQDIAWAIVKSIADRIVALVKRVGIEQDIAMSGGMAKNRALVARLEDRIGFDILVPQEPQLMGAFGAAIIAKVG
ncbi:MAG: acyl-CoA dehydratase activase [Deltaproteobacteria bacterium]|nr:acyl-CoA dehydratase activase [Deltaproteobacteria bacterium]MCL5276692.1 acyl-CoA dehydratase activase [Deltaproteobacteria bacterium]